MNVETDRLSRPDLADTENSRELLVINLRLKGLQRAWIDYGLPWAARDGADAALEHALRVLGETRKRRA